MAVFCSVSFDVPEARLLADLAGIQGDLLAVEEYCDRFLTEHANTPSDGTILEVLCAAALIRYGRVLASGVRVGLPIEIIHSLAPEDQVWHQYFKAARDKWIAHSVNTFEDNEVRAWLMPPERGPLGITGVTVRRMRVRALGSEAMVALRLLAINVRQRVQELADVENARVLAFAQSLPPEPFYSQEDPTRAFGTEHPSQTRNTGGSGNSAQTPDNPRP